MEHKGAKCGLASRRKYGGVEYSLSRETVRTRIEQKRKGQESASLPRVCSCTGSSSTQCLSEPSHRSLATPKQSYRLLVPVCAVCGAFVASSMLLRCS